MIYDSMENFNQYAAISPRAWRCVADFCKNLTPADLVPGRRPLDGDLIRVDVNRYDTKNFADGKLELHRRYADIQVMIEGGEEIHVGGVDGLPVIAAYDPERDCAFYAAAGAELVKIPLNQGTFAFFPPGEGHMPGIGAPARTICKLVFKVDKSLLQG